MVKGTFNGTTSRGPIIDFSNMAELVSYRDIVPHIDINSPRLLYQSWEAEPSESVVLLFEDMAYRRPTYYKRYSSPICTLPLTKPSWPVNFSNRLASACREVTPKYVCMYF